MPEVLGGDGATMTPDRIQRGIFDAIAVLAFPAAVMLLRTVLG